MEDEILLIHEEQSNKEHYFEYNRSQIVNKYKDDELEINQYMVAEGITLMIEPPEQEGAIKTYYVFCGSLRHVETNKVLTAGDIIIVKSTMGINSFLMLEPTQLLVHSSKYEVYGRILSNNSRISQVLQEIQNKDSYTKEHCDRVFKLTQRLSQILGYKGEKYLNICLASRYHDVGKVYIEDGILNKPGALNTEEYECMKRHAVLGKDMIMEMYNEKVFKIVAQHHERVDGSGYPLGLKGEQIEEEALMLAICDSYDAMITDRVYQKGMSSKAALEELGVLSGTKYDARLVTLFTQMILEE